MHVSYLLWHRITLTEGRESLATKSRSLTFLLKPLEVVSLFLDVHFNTLHWFHIIIVQWIAVQVQSVIWTVCNLKTNHMVSIIAQFQNLLFWYTISFVSFGAGFSSMTVGFSIKKIIKKKPCQKHLHQGSNAEKFTTDSSARRCFWPTTKFT
jgi:hypothetical protein